MLNLLVRGAEISASSTAHFACPADVPPGTRAAKDVDVLSLPSARPVMSSWSAGSFGTLRF